MTAESNETPGENTAALRRRSFCDHCGLPVAATKTTASEEQSEPLFCCYGCALAYRIWGGGREPSESFAAGILGRMMLAILFAMASMVFSIALYSNAIFPASGSGGHPLGPLAPVLQFLAIAFALPAVGLLGWTLFFQNVSHLDGTRGIGSVNGLILAGVGAALALSIHNAWRGHGEIYVETAVMVLVFMTLGRYLEAQARRQVTHSLNQGFTLEVKSASRLLSADVGAEDVEEVSVDALNAGDQIRVVAGECLPVDGHVRQGSGALDRSLLSGESDAQRVHAGDVVYAGGMLVDGSIVVGVDSIPGERLIDRIAELAESARLSRMPLERLSERVANWFLPFAIVAALGTTVFWATRVELSEAILNGLAVLLISCPCALGIATPLATWVAFGRAARHGVLVRRADIFEKLSGAVRIFLDKTGTLTTNTLTVREVVVAAEHYRERLERVAAAITNHSRHPASSAIRRYLDETSAGSEIPKPNVQVAGVSVRPGLGIVAKVEGRKAMVGNLELLSLEFPAASLARDAVKLAELTAARCQGDAPRVWVAHDGTLLGGFVLSEVLRTDAGRAVEELRNRGVVCEILSGDKPRRVGAVANAVGIRGVGGLLPDAKAQSLREARAQGNATVVMVGDGFNDAPGFPTADVGIAVDSGVDLAKDSADVVLLEAGGAPLLGLPFLLDLARQTVWRVRFNLFWAFLYNTVGMAFASAGKIHPLAAVGLMIGSSLFVVLGSTAGIGAQPSQSSREASSWNENRDDPPAPKPTKTEGEERAGLAAV